MNEILTNSRTRSVLMFKDIVLLDEEEEYMKRAYLKKEYPHKIKLLTEYYKVINQTTYNLFQSILFLLLNSISLFIRTIHHFFPFLIHFY